MKKLISKQMSLVAVITTALCGAGNLLAADPPAFTPNITTTADIASNYVFRGADVYQNKFAQDGKAYGSMNIAPAFQPSATFNFAEGWSLNIWGSFALIGRKDKDTDALFQTGPGDTTLATVPTSGYLDSILNGTPYNFGAAYTTPTTAQLGRTANEPGYHKEANGLGRTDEIDLTLSYNFNTKLGTMTGGVISYNYPNIVQQSATNLELFAGFAPAALPELSLTVYVEGVTPAGSSYSYLAYTKAIEIGKDKNVTIAPGVGYATNTGLKIAGVKNVNLPVTLNLGGFHAGVTAVYRPNLAFFDTDPYKGNGVTVVGDSTMFDGLVVDPSRTNGLANALVNRTIQNGITASGANYTYTPRTALPKTLIYYLVGYTATF